MKKIIITPRPSVGEGKVYIDKLESVGYQVGCNNSGGRYSKEELIEKIKDVNAIITGNDPLSKEVIDQAKDLRVISRYGVGSGNVDVDCVNSRDIVVHKALNTDSISVVEITILVMLSSSRKYVEIESQTRGGKDIRLVGYELYQKNLGLTRLGAIGQHVAHIIHSMGMTITVHDPHIDKSKVPSYIELKSPDEIYQYSDVISLHLPLLDSTRNMINDSVFEKMRSSAILINTARGGLVGEKSLYTVLSNQKTAFASEDIGLREHSKELTELKNYSITPHAASFTGEADHNIMQISIRNVLQELEKEQ